MDLRKFNRTHFVETETSDEYADVDKDEFAEKEKEAAEA